MGNFSASHLAVLAALLCEDVARCSSVDSLVSDVCTEGKGVSSEPLEQKAVNFVVFKHVDEV